MDGEGLAIDTIYHGDAFSLLPQVPSGSVDLIITDPPFAIDFTAQKGNYNRSGDRVLEGYREVPRDEYLPFSLAWLKEASRVLKEDGSMYVFSGWNQLKDILIALDECGFATINHLIWKYQFGVYTKKKFVTSHYHVLFVAKNSKSYTFHKQDHYPEDVLVINREYWKGRQKTPTKLPGELVEKLMRYSSNEGDLVLDPFGAQAKIADPVPATGRAARGG
ncbi:MAG: site-specific DNA-methyltransferase, partial [Methanomicrobiaceae archaeon]|nr:site-specific DNA-methyltransferase [Methanomicrobiaceae archaeon]